MPDLPDMEPVESSSLRMIGYKPGPRELYVEFVESGRYVYFGVPEELFEGLRAAASKGAYLTARSSSAASPTSASTNPPLVRPSSAARPASPSGRCQLGHRRPPRG